MPPDTSSLSPFSKGFQREQKRRAILSEAARLFNIHGARETTLDDISAALNLNKASLYYYVRSKDDLVFQCYLESCDLLAGLVEKADAEGHSGAGKVAAFIRGFFLAWKAILENRRDHVAILSELRAMKPEHRNIVVPRYREIQDRLKAFIREGQKDGSLETERASDTALALFGLLQLTVLWLPYTELSTFENSAEIFTDIVFRGVEGGSRSADGADLAAMTGPSLMRFRDSDDSRLDGFCRSASDVFNAKGYKGASLEEVVQRLQVTKGSFYHHFRDKDELLYQCFCRTLSWIREVQHQSEKKAESGLAALQLCAGQLFRIQNSSLGPLVRFNLILSLSEPRREEILEGIRSVSEEFGRLIRRGIEDGSLRAVDPFIAEQLLLAAIDISAELKWNRRPGNLGRDFSSYFGFFFRGIATETGFGVTGENQ